MPHSESAWRAEINAHAPRSGDLAELSSQVPDLSSWRLLICEEAAMKECLEDWAAYVQARRIAVLIEQASEDGVLRDEADIASRLDGCPAEWRVPFDTFVQSAPECVREFLVYECHGLVQVERERRTGSPDWQSDAASGSLEVLRELMFKWGPRHHRHRWTW